MGFLESIRAALFGEPEPPKKRARSTKRERNPLSAEDIAERERAKQMSRELHGDENQVVELSDKERRMPRFAVVVGRVESLDYQARKGSKLAGTVYTHTSGDYGTGQKGRKRPVLLVDPNNSKPIVLPGESPMHLDTDRGLIG